MKFFKNPIKTPEAGRRLTSGAVAVVIIAAVLAANILLAYLTQMFDWFFYKVKYNEDFSISGSTDEVFREAIEAGRQVKITFLDAEDKVKYHTTGAPVYNTAKALAERHPEFITLDFVNIYTGISDVTKTKIPLEKYTKDYYGNEVGLTKTTVLFSTTRANGEEVWRSLTNVYNGLGYVDFYTFDSSGMIISYNGETIMTAMALWVLKDEHKKAYITINHGEDADATFATLLIAAGYSVDFINLQDKSVPDDAELLIISNPKNDFERSADGTVKTEMERLTEYVERGGDLYISLDPYVKRLNNLESFIERYGIKLSTSEVDGAVLRNMVRDPNNAITTDGYTLIAELADNELANKISATVEKFADGGILLREACALELSDPNSALLVSSRSSVCEVGSKVTDRDGSYPIAAMVSYKHEGAESESNIFVIPSIYLTASDALTSGAQANRDFLYSLFDEAFGAHGLPYGCNSVTYVTDQLSNLTMGKAKLYTAILLSIPCAVAVAGAVVIIRRKNR